MDSNWSECYKSHYAPPVSNHTNYIAVSVHAWYCPHSSRIRKKFWWEHCMQLLPDPVELCYLKHNNHMLNVSSSLILRSCVGGEWSGDKAYVSQSLCHVPAYKGIDTYHTGMVSVLKLLSLWVDWMVVMNCLP